MKNLYFLDQSEKQRCPFSTFKGRENLVALNGSLVFDSFGMRNSVEYSEAHAIVMGSSVVFGGRRTKSLTDFMNSYDSRSYYNCSCGSWNSTQSVSQYIYSIAPAISHKHVIFLCGYNDIFGPISYDPRPQFPYNFFVEAEVMEALNCSNNHQSLEFDFDSGSFNVNPSKIRKTLVEGLYLNDGMHIAGLTSGWINALKVLLSYCTYYEKNLHIVPQLTLLDKKNLSAAEENMVSSSPGYYEIFRYYKSEYWKLIKNNLQLFEIPDVISMLDSSEQVFTDQVHLTEFGYRGLAQYLCSLI